MTACPSCATDYATGDICPVCGSRLTPDPLGTWGQGRTSPHRGLQLFVNGAKDAENPFKDGSKSHAAFEFVRHNPGVRFEDAIAMGCRQRTITELIRAGRLRAVT